MDRELILLWYNGRDLSIREADQKVPYLFSTEKGQRTLNGFTLPCILGIGFYCFEDEIDMFKEDVKNEFISAKEELKEKVMAAMEGTMR